MNILFRADSSSTIGIGHIMRDLVLAKEYEQQGHNIFFACRELEGNIIDKIPHEVIVLNSNDMEELQSVIEKYAIDMLVIDHYEIGYEEEKQFSILNSQLSIMVLDDTYEKHYCNILLNHNICADEDRYKDLVPEFCEIRCGFKYTLLRDEFKKEKKIKREKIYDYFVAMGGADTANLNIPILELLPKDKKVAIVTTSANKNLQELKDFVKNKNNIKFFIDSNEIAKLLNQSRFAIITPSVTVHEVLFMGVDFLAIKIAENQEEMAKWLRSKGLFVISKSYLSNLKIYLAKPSLKNFTELTEDESKMVLSWRNSPKISKWMINKNNIDSHEHNAFLHSLKKRKDKSYFLIYAREVAVGVVDIIMMDNHKAEIGLYANPHKKGVGRYLLSSLIKIAKDRDIKTLIAKVFSDNKIAISLYQKYGFQKIDKEEALEVMELML